LKRTALDPLRLYVVLTNGIERRGGWTSINIKRRTIRCNH